MRGKKSKEKKTVVKESNAQLHVTVQIDWCMAINTESSLCGWPA